MIRAMVDGLDDKLNVNGDDLEGWLRLIRSRAVLNETDRAKAALAAARQQFKGNPQALSALEGLAKELRLN
jgi:cytochrome c-type biogenesis protein CcmH